MSIKRISNDESVRDAGKIPLVSGSITGEVANKANTTVSEQMHHVMVAH